MSNKKHKFNFITDHRSKAEIYHNKKGQIVFKNLSHECLDQKDAVQLFEDELQLDSYLSKNTRIDTWELIDCRDKNNSKTIFKHIVGGVFSGFDTEVETFTSERALNYVLSKESQGAWVVAYHDQDRFNIQDYLLEQSGWLQTTYETYTERQAFLSAAKQKFSKRERRNQYISLGIAALNISGTIVSVATTCVDTMRHYSNWAMPDYALNTLSSAAVLGSLGVSQTGSFSLGLASLAFLSHPPSVSAQPCHFDNYDFRNVDPDFGADGSDGVKLGGYYQYQRVGSALAVGDVTGDGISDAIVGMPASTGHGGVIVLFGGVAGFPADINVEALRNGNATFGFVIEGENARTGASVAAADFNADGIDDIILGDPEYDGQHGRVVVLFGRDTAINPFPARFYLSDVSTGNATEAIEFLGMAGSDKLGESLALCKLTGNSQYLDLIMGAPSAGNTQFGRIRAGLVAIMRARNLTQFPYAASVDLSTINRNEMIIIQGAEGDNSNNQQHHAGAALTCGGDNDHDGRVDLVVSAHNAFPAGALYFIRGRAASSPFPNEIDAFDIQNSDDTYGSYFSGLGSNKGSLAVDNSGDSNGDNIADISISQKLAANRGGVVSTGRLYEVFGRNVSAVGTFPAQLNIDEIAVSGNGTQGFVIDGIDNSDFPCSVVSGIDLNGDGMTERMWGIENGDGGNNGRLNSGDVLTFWGRDDVVSASPRRMDDAIDLVAGNRTIGFAYYGARAGDRFGCAIGGGYRFDFNNDGCWDLIFGAPGALSVEHFDDPWAGAAYILFGCCNATPSPSPVPTSTPSQAPTSSPASTSTPSAPSSVPTPSPGFSPTTLFPTPQPTFSTVAPFPTPPSSSPTLSPFAPSLTPGTTLPVAACFLWFCENDPTGVTVLKTAVSIIVLLLIAVGMRSCWYFKKKKDSANQEMRELPAEARTGSDDSRASVSNGNPHSSGVFHSAVYANALPASSGDDAPASDDQYTALPDDSHIPPHLRI